MDYVPVDYFDVAIEHVFHWEGGEVNDPRDPGGHTKFGISKRSYPELDISALTRGKARQIYRQDFWEACRCDELPGPLAVMVFDAAVNQGTKRAAKFLQLALGVKPDGVIGSVTVGAANAAPLRMTMLMFSVRRALHYVKLSTFRTYGKGWLTRLFDTHTTAITAYVQEARLQERVP